MNTTAKFDYAMIPSGKTFTVRLMLALEGDQQSDKNRTPLNISLALDRSGSMGGAKLRNVKAATQLLVENLSKDDIFSLTIFDNTVRPLVYPVSIKDAHDIEWSINAIRSGGSTFLSGGYEEACRLAGKNLSERYVTRVMLLTDGLANMGVVEPVELAARAASMQQKGITTTTIGVGLDYDESLLSSMAEFGGGGSYTIENPGDAVSVFQEELGFLKSLSATDCQVRFVPAVHGITFAQLNSFPISSQGSLLLGDIYEGRRKSLVLEIELPPLEEEAEKNIGYFEISYRDATFGNKEEHLRLNVAIDAVSSGEFAGTQAERDVTLEACFLIVARAKAESIKLADAGQFEQAAALLEMHVEALRGIGIQDTALDLEFLDLKRRAQDLRAGGDRFYTSFERKRMHHESNMMLKSCMSSYRAMKERR